MLRSPVLQHRELRPEEHAFLASRARFVAAWPIVGGVLLFGILALAVWLLSSQPLLANPYFVAQQLSDGSISSATLTLMAGLLPLVVLMCVLLLIAVVLFAFSALSTEKRYQSILRRLTTGDQSARLPGP